MVVLRSNLYFVSYSDDAGHVLGNRLRTRFLIGFLNDASKRHPVALHANIEFCFEGSQHSSVGRWQLAHVDRARPPLDPRMETLRSARSFRVALTLFRPPGRFKRCVRAPSRARIDFESASSFVSATYGCIPTASLHLWECCRQQVLRSCIFQLACLDGGFSLVRGGLLCSKLSEKSGRDRDRRDGTLSIQTLCTSSRCELMRPPSIADPFAVLIATTITSPRTKHRSTSISSA